MGANDSLAAHPEHCLAFFPPFIIHNVLPFEVEVFLQDHASATEQERLSWTIPRGSSQEVYNFDMTRKLKMHVHLKVPSPALSSMSGLEGLCHDFAAVIGAPSLGNIQPIPDCSIKQSP